MNEFTEIAERMLAGRKPMSGAEWDQHVFRTELLPRMRNWGFDDRFSEVQTLNDSQRHALDLVCQKMVRTGAIVALVGIRGVGKTTIAAQFALAKAKRYGEEALRGGPGLFENVSYRKASNVVARFKSLYSDYGDVRTEALMEARDYYCYQNDFVVIDELHECDDQKMKNRVLTDILDRRYASRRDSLLISNQTPEEFQATTSDSIISRLSEHGVIIPCEWQSFRTNP